MLITICKWRKREFKTGSIATFWSPPWFLLCYHHIMQLLLNVRTLLQFVLYTWRLSHLFLQHRALRRHWLRIKGNRLTFFFICFYFSCNWFVKHIYIPIFFYQLLYYIYSCLVSIKWFLYPWMTFYFIYCRALQRITVKHP